MGATAGAHRTWFHLLGLLIEQPSRNGVDALSEEEQDKQLSQLAVAIEQFLQSATLGEFAKRLRLLSTFERHVQAEVLSAPYQSAPLHLHLVASPASFLGPYWDATGRLWSCI